MWSTFRDPSRVRVVRTGSLLALALCGAMFFASLGRESGFITSGGSYLALGDGCLRVGVNDPTYRTATGATGWFLRRSYQHDWALAWRPFRVHTVMCAGPIVPHFVAVPLWPCLAAALWCSAWAHGRLTSVRTRLSPACHTCGYDLSGIATAASPNSPRTQRCACPECGTPIASNAPSALA